MNPTEAEPLTRSIQAVRWLYYACMAVGLPLWFLATFILVAWLRFTLAPPHYLGSIESSTLSAAQIHLLKAACIAFFLLYPAALFWSHRITRQPWVVFAAMLLPVLAFCYAVICFPITDSNSEQISWLAYLGSLAFLLGIGTITGLSFRHVSSHHPGVSAADR